MLQLSAGALVRVGARVTLFRNRPLMTVSSEVSQESAASLSSLSHTPMSDIGDWTYSGPMYLPTSVHLLLGHDAKALQAAVHTVRIAYLQDLQKAQRQRHAGLQTLQ